MKVLHITTSSKGGAGIAALRLHDALRAAGVSSGYLSKDLTIDFNGNEIADDFFIYKKPSFFQKVLQKLKKIMSQADEQKLQKKLSSLAPELHYEMISTPYSSYKLENHPLVQESSVINLHMVSIVLDYKRFFLAIKKPIVWTLHDLNPFSGLFHYQEDEIRNKTLVSAINERLYLLKRNAIQNSSLRAVVTPSNWLGKEAQSSTFFPGSCSYQTIANSIAIPSIDIEAIVAFRKELQINENEFVFLFVAHNLTSQRKGMDLLLGALGLLQHIPLTILTIGSGTLDFHQENIKMIPLGSIDTSEKMMLCYAASDAFLLPSREDNLPNVMLESFATGTPVISFAVGGMQEHIIHGITGFIAPELTSESFATAITDFINEKNSFDAEIIKDYTSQYFSPQDQALKYMEVYTTITSI